MLARLGLAALPRGLHLAAIAGGATGLTRRLLALAAGRRAASVGGRRPSQSGPRAAYRLITSDL